MSNQEDKWYNKNVTVIVLLILFFPVGIYGLWKNKNFSSTIKLVITSVFGIFIIISGIGNSNRENSRVVQQNNVQPEKRLANSNKDIKTEKNHKIGESFQLGDFNYSINNIQRTQFIGNRFVSEQSNTGASFVIVTFSITNESNKTKTVLTDDFKILDNRGREFQPSSRANTALVMSRGKEFVLSELQPGIPQTIQTAFEIPDSAENIFLEIPEKGLFSTGKIRVALVD